MGELFDEFWEAYPKKVAKVVAERRFAKLNPSPLLFAIIIKALEVQKRQPSWQKDRGQYVPHASTWLHQKRWQDSVVMEPRYREGPLAKPRWYDLCDHAPACMTKAEHELKLLKATAAQEAP